MTVFKPLQEYELSPESQSGEIDENFKNWLNSSFGFYSGYVLISNDWDSTLIYQYDFELEAFKSSYNNIYLSDVDTWSVECKDGYFVLNLQASEHLWASFKLYKLQPLTPIC